MFPIGVYSLPRKVIARAHYLHQHLIRVCRPIEGTGARTVVGSRLRLDQRVPSDLAFGIGLANFCLFIVWQSRGHRARRDEHRWQMSKGQGPYHESRHDLVANAEIARGLASLV